MHVTKHSLTPTANRCSFSELHVFFCMSHPPFEVKGHQHVYKRRRDRSFYHCPVLQRLVKSTAITMPSYKLHYFPIRARGELIRLLFAAAGKTFTDQHITFADWPSKKPEMPTGQLPVLEIDGEKLSQSLTIARYLSREFGLAGDNSLDQARADQVTDTISDLLGEFFKYAFEKDAAKKEEIKTKLFDSVLPTFATNVTKFLDMNKTKSGYFVGKKLTVADLAVYEGFEDFLLVDPKSLDKHPKLVAHRKLVLTNPKVKAYLDKRPKTDV